MKILIKAFLTLFLVLSLVVNGLLLVSKAGFDFLTDLLDNLGLNPPVVQMKKNNQNIKKQNQKLKKQNQNMKKGVRGYAKKKQTKLVKRSARKVADSSLKSAAAFIPAGANVVIAGSVMFDMLELAEMCEDLNELESLIESMDFEPSEDKGFFDSFTPDKVKVCGKRIKQVSQASAEGIFSNIQGVSDMYFEQFKDGTRQLSSDVKDTLGKSVGGLLQMKQRINETSTCDLLGENTCKVFSWPFETACELTDNKLSGCVSQ